MEMKQVAKPNNSNKNLSTNMKIKKTKMQVKII